MTLWEQLTLWERRLGAIGLLIDRCIAARARLPHPWIVRGRERRSPLWERRLGAIGLLIDRCIAARAWLPHSLRAAWLVGPQIAFLTTAYLASVRARA